MHDNLLEEFENYVKNTGNQRRKKKLNDSNSTIVLKQQKLNIFQSLHRTNEKQKQFENNILNYVVCSMKPLSTVEDENFIKIINGMYIF